MNPALRLVPKTLTTRLLGHCFRSSASRGLIPWYCRHYCVDIAEAARPLDQYASLQEFFCRELKPGLRPPDPDPRAVLSPVDGTVAQCGPIEDGRLLQAKGAWYSLAELLGRDEAEAERYRGGWYATIYLAPRDYHRIHAPVDGAVVLAHYLPGDFWPVNAAAVAAIPRLLARNERLVSILEGSLGRFALVKVGALIVGGIRVTYDPDFPRHRSRAERLAPSGSSPTLARGQELGRFEFGSTVIVLAPAGAWRPEPILSPGAVVRVGQALARLKPS